MSHLIQLTPTRQPPRVQRLRLTRHFQTLIQLAKLHQIAFPDREHQEDHWLKIDSDLSVVDAIMTFLQEVDEHHFPLTEVWGWVGSGLQESNVDENLIPWLYQIPVLAMGFDEETSPDDHPGVIELLMRLTSVRGNSLAAQTHKQILHLIYPEWEWNNLLDTFSLSPLIPTLEQMRLLPPFHHLPSLVKVVTHETDTFFLDFTMEHWPHYIFWSQKSFHWLKQDWSKAKKMKNEADKLTGWLLRNHQQLPKVWAILKTAHQRSQHD